MTTSNLYKELNTEDQEGLNQWLDEREADQNWYNLLTEKEWERWEAEHDRWEADPEGYHIQNYADRRGI